MNATKEENKPEAERAKPAEKQDDIVVFITGHDGQCSECKGDFSRGDMIRVEQGNPLCLECADLGHLEYLPRGDTAVTRRASKLSPLRAVVVEWSRSRQRYERQGILATPGAIAQAENDSLADAQLRERQRARAAVRREAAEETYVATVTSAIRTQFPGCPAGGGRPDRRVDLSEALGAGRPERGGQEPGSPGAAAGGDRPHPSRAHRL